MVRLGRARLLGPKEVTQAPQGDSGVHGLGAWEQVLGFPQDENIAIGAGNLHSKDSLSSWPSFPREV